MGTCHSRGEEKPTTFTKEEKIKLKGVYAFLTDGEGSDVDNNRFVNVFHENPAFGKRLYSFLKSYSEEKIITYDLFQNIAEILIKDTFEGYKLEYSNFDKMELLALVNIGKKIKKREDLHNEDITYIQAIQYVKDFLQIFNIERINHQIDEYAIVSLLNNIFDKNSAQMKWGSFLLNLKEKLFFLNNLIKNFFAHKFLDTTPSFKLPTLSSPSYLLNHESLSLLYLSNSFLQTARKLKLIYSSTADNWNFENLNKILTDYKGSSLLLFRHEESLEFAYDKTSTKKDYIFGVFQYMAWGDINQNTKGSEETYIFTITPGFKNLVTKKNYDNAIGKQFTVINNAPHQNLQGFGFGKLNDGKYRLWIDKRLNEGSYCSSKDEVFESGVILDPYIQKFNIKLVEVWGLENSRELNYHHVLGYTNTVLVKPEVVDDKKQEFYYYKQENKNFEQEMKKLVENALAEKNK